MTSRRQVHNAEGMLPPPPTFGGPLGRWMLGMCMVGAPQSPCSKCGLCATNTMALITSGCVQCTVHRSPCSKYGLCASTMARITSGCVFRAGAAGRRAEHPRRCGAPQHRLFFNTMAPITSDCDAMRSLRSKWP